MIPGPLPARPGDGQGRARAPTNGGVSAGVERIGRTATQQAYAYVPSRLRTHRKQPWPARLNLKNEGSDQQGRAKTAGGWLPFEWVVLSLETAEHVGSTSGSHSALER